MGVQELNFRHVSDVPGDEPLEENEEDLQQYGEDDDDLSTDADLADYAVTAKGVRRRKKPYTLNQWQERLGAQRVLSKALKKRFKNKLFQVWAAVIYIQG